MTSRFLALALLVVLTGTGCTQMASVPRGSSPTPSTPPPDASGVTSYATCVEAGFPVMMSYPSQCAAGGVTYTEDIGNELEMSNMITVAEPRPNTKVASPLTITGEARGTYYFEASFPVMLEDANGNVLANGVATAETDWMTEAFVPFTASLTFYTPLTPTGTLVLKKDNPSGDAVRDAELRIPVNF